MSKIDALTDCHYKAKNVITAANSVLFDEFENEFLLENYLECLRLAEKTVIRRLEELANVDSQST